MTASGSQHPLALLAPPPGRPGHPIPIRGTSLKIGQGPQNDVVLDDDTVSTSHARLELVQGAWQLTDLGSRNGTFVNGERLAANGTALVAAETPVAFGAVKLVFSLETGDVVAAPEVVSPPSAAPPAPARLEDRGGFRLPVWVLLLIIVAIVVIAVIVLGLGGAPDSPAALLSESVVLLALESVGTAS